MALLLCSKQLQAGGYVTVKHWNDNITNDHDFHIKVQYQDYRNNDQEKTQSKKAPKICSFDIQDYEIECEPGVFPLQALDTVIEYLDGELGVDISARYPVANAILEVCSSMIDHVDGGSRSLFVNIEIGHDPEIIKASLAHCMVQWVSSKDCVPCSCCVCLEDIAAEADVEMGKLPCEHIFHGACLIEWAVKSFKPSCPLCRFELPFD